MYRVNEKLKSEVIGRVIENSSGLRKLAKCVKIAIPIAIVLALAYACLFLFVPGLGEVIVAGEAKKEIVPIISRTVLILVFGFLIHYCCGLMLNNRTSKDLTERTDEEITIANSEIRYVFRTRYVTAPDNRVIVVIPFRDLTEVNYTENTRKIEFVGRISSDVIEKYNPAREYNPNKGNLNKLIIYDYFTPNLLNALRKNGLI